MRISDWSSDVCSSDLAARLAIEEDHAQEIERDQQRRPLRIEPHAQQRFPPKTAEMAGGCRRRPAAVELHLQDEMHRIDAERRVAVAQLPIPQIVAAISCNRNIRRTTLPVALTHRQTAPPPTTPQPFPP